MIRRRTHQHRADLGLPRGGEAGGRELRVIVGAGALAISSSSSGSSLPFAAAHDLEVPTWQRASRSSVFRRARRQKPPNRPRESTQPMTSAEKCTTNWPGPP